MADNNYIHIGSNSGKGSSSGPSISSNVDQDALLPIANIGRIMKQVLPPSSKLSKEAKETMQECASEFISFITGEASHKCLREKRKTMNGDDVCWALASLGFDDYYAPLSRYLQRYRDAVDAERANQMCKAYFHHHHHHHQGQGKEE